MLTVNSNFSGYPPIPVPEGTPPLVREPVITGVDAMLSEVHRMLSIGQDGVTMHHSIANTVLAVISGLGATFFADLPEKDQFKTLMTAHFPWGDLPPEVDNARACSILWEYFRNPLVHRLRLLHDDNQAKFGQTLKIPGDALRKLATGELLSTKPPLAIKGDKYVLWVDGLYFGARRALDALLGSHERCAVAQRALEELGFLPEHMRKRLLKPSGAAVRCPDASS